MIRKAAKARKDGETGGEGAGGIDEAGLRAAAARLVDWFAAHRRDLPWRKPVFPEDSLREPAPGYPGREGAPFPRRDPYAVWIAEIMLQQTQVATVIDYFSRWMKRFPDVATLARAGDDEVLSQWAGLGYYSRARNILVTARAVMERHGGIFPWRRAELLDLKGIGEYTAGAISSLAYGLPEPILDGNLVRVFSRLYALDFLPDTAGGKASYWSLARAWAENGPPELVNEGLMELGALVCTPRNPACGECPLAGGCRAGLEGRQESLPPPKARRDGVEIRGIALVTLRGNDVLLYRPLKGELLAGLLTFPVFEVAGMPALRAAWKERLPELPPPDFRPRSAQVTHSITHHAFRLRLAEARLPGGADGPLPRGYLWAPAADVDGLLVSSFPRKIWRAFA
jgi:A/G-specific adenine glycosylase